MTTHIAKCAHETEHHFVIRMAKGFEVYRIGATASTRCAVIGYEGERGLIKAKLEVTRREGMS